MGVLESAISHLRGESEMIRSAPVSICLSALALAALAAVGLWFLFSWRYDTRFSNLETGNTNLETALQNKDSQIGIQQGTITFQSEQLAAFRQIPSSALPQAKVDVRSSDGGAELEFSSAIDQTPKLVASTNLWRWNYAVSQTRQTDANGNQKTLASFYWVFLVFDKPVSFKTMLIASSTNQLPAWSLLDSSERTAMVALWGDVSNRRISFKVAP